MCKCISFLTKSQMISDPNLSRRCITYYYLLEVKDPVLPEAWGPEGNYITLRPMYRLNKWDAW